MAISRKKRAIRIALGCLVAFALLYGFAAARYLSKCSVERASCAEHRLAGCSIDGVYPVKIGPALVDAQCDMESERGGWTLVLNYVHKKKGAKAVDPLAPLSERLPLIKSKELGDDESGDAKSWGHADTRILGTLPFKEARFKCGSSAHQRVLDFSISSPQCLDYFRSGKGACIGAPIERYDYAKANAQEVADFVKGVTKFRAHTGNLPFTVDTVMTNQGDRALAINPFFADWKQHWKLGGAENQWECDDNDSSGINSTLHQVWVR